MHEISSDPKAAVRQLTWIVMVGCFVAAAVALSAAAQEVKGDCQAFVRGEAEAFYRKEPVGDSVDFWYMNGAEGIVGECQRLLDEWNAGRTSEHQRLWRAAMAGEARGSFQMNREEEGQFTFHALLRGLARFPEAGEETFYKAAAVAVHDFLHGRVLMARVMRQHGQI